MKEIKEKLLSMQQELMDEIEDDRSKSNSAITHEVGDSIDLATEERDREFYQLLCDRDRAKLEQIKEALDKMDSDDYGTCEECDAEISKKRLLAMPFASLCIDCKNEEERTKGKDLNYDPGTSGLSGMESDEF